MEKQARGVGQKGCRGRVKDGVMTLQSKVNLVSFGGVEGVKLL